MTGANHGTVDTCGENVIQGGVSSYEGKGRLV